MSNRPPHLEILQELFSGCCSLSRELGANAGLVCMTTDRARPEVIPFCLHSELIELPQFESLESVGIVELSLSGPCHDARASGIADGLGARKQGLIQFG